MVEVPSPQITDAALSIEDARQAGLRAARAALASLYAPFATRIGALASAVDPVRTAALAPCFAVRFQVQGPLRGEVVLVLAGTDVPRFADALLRRTEAAPQQPDHDARGAVTEMANILVSSFLNGVAASWRARLVPSIPRVEVDAPVPALAKGALIAELGVTFVTAAVSALFVVSPSEGASSLPIT